MLGLLKRIGATIQPANTKENQELLELESEKAIKIANDILKSLNIRYLINVYTDHFDIDFYKDDVCIRHKTYSISNYFRYALLLEDEAKQLRDRKRFRQVKENSVIDNFFLNIKYSDVLS